MCNTKTHTSGGSAVHAYKTATEIHALTDLTVAQMKEVRAKKKELNHGAYVRAMMLKQSKAVTLTTPLSLLHFFWGLNIYYPCRNLVSFELEMKENKQILVVDVTSSQKYKLEITDIFLQLSYGVFHTPIRDRWTSAITTNLLRRNCQSVKEVHFTLGATKFTGRFPAIFNWSTLPGTMIIAMITEKAYMGNFSLNRFHYQEPGIKSLRVYVSGKPYCENELTQEMDLSPDSWAHLYFYQKFVKTFGDAALDITPESFLRDFFMMPVHLQPSLVLDGQSTVSLKGKDRILNPVEGAHIDCEIDFSKPLAENMVIFFMGHWDFELAFDQNGLPVDL